MTIFYKDPDETLDYYIDWGTLFLAGDTIIGSVWIVPSGITQVSTSNTTTRTTIWLSGGTIGESKLLTNRITTAAGRIKEQKILIVIAETT